MRIHNKSLLLSIVVALTLGSVSVASANTNAQGAIVSMGKSLATITTVAGLGEFNNADGAAPSATFRTPQGIAVLKDGSMIVADTNNHLLRQVKDGQVTTYAGLTFDVNNIGLPSGGLVDGVKAEAIFQSPSDIDVDAFGNMYVADADNNVIRKIDTSGNVSILAGSPDGEPGYADGRGSAVLFNHPTDLVVTPAGVVYVADTLNHVIRKVTTIGSVTTLNTVSDRTVEVHDGQVELSGNFKDGSLEDSLFNEPTGLALDAKGNLYVSDSGNHLIRYIDLSANTVSAIAGGSAVTYPEASLYAQGDYADGAAMEAKFDFPKGLAVTPEGGLLIADSLNNAVRYLYDGKVTTIVGNADASFGDSDGTERSAQLHHPSDVEIDANGNIYVADAYNNKIRKISYYKLPEGLTKDGNIHVVKGDTEITFDAKPQNINGRVMVPVRAIAESLGYVVKSSDNVKITLEKDTTTIELVIGSTEITQTIDRESEQATIDAKPFIRDNRTYVPVRFISEQLGLQVDWSQAYRTVIVR
jgi:hypothetical protein